MAMPNKPILALVMSLAVASVVAETAVFAQDTIDLGPSTNEMVFQGTGSNVIKVVWQNCHDAGCTMEGGGSRGNNPLGAGTYKFSSPTPVPFKLVSTAIGLFSVDQSAEVSFSYTSPHGTAIGLAHFTSVVQNPGAIGARLTGTLQVTGGTYQSYFAAGQGNLSLTLTIGKQNLSTLIDSTGSIQGGIDFPSTLSPPSSCRAASIIPAALTGPAMHGGDYIWFSARFNASGIREGTFIHFQRGFVQFQAAGRDYMLHVPDAVVTFSAAKCASTSFSTRTNSWQTTVPFDEAGEIFLSGFAFPVPASGLPGAPTLVNWSESFSSNVPNVSIQWQWGVELFSSFSMDLSALGVKATNRNACQSDNADHAGAPENFPIAGAAGARQPGANNVSWSTTAHAETNCP